MREYRFQADSDSIETFRRLRGAWRDVQASERSVTVRLADGTAVQFRVELHDIEPGFAATCLVADDILDGTAHDDMPQATVYETSDLGLGGNDVVLFTGATWLSVSKVESEDERIDASRMEAVVQQSGTAEDVPAEAEAVCITHDAIVIASPVGTGCLIRVGSMSGRLDVFTDRAVIAAFLTTRSYRTDSDSEAETAPDTASDSETQE